ncbi:MAG: FHA domain-containing protein [Gammaproteobacteria bacterium]
MARPRRACSAGHCSHRLVAAALGLATTLASPAATLTDNLDIRCLQPSATTLLCSCRPLDGTTLSAVTARYDGTTLAGELRATYPAANDSTAVLVLVAPAEGPLADRLGAVLGALLVAGRPHHRFGLASTADDFTVLAPPGSDAQTITSAAAAAAAVVPAASGPAHLAAALHAALRQLARTPASRRVLLLLAEKAGDAGQQHAALVSAARSAAVIVHIVGFPPTAGAVSDLAALRDLSRATGGRYVQAETASGLLPATVLPALLAAADAGSEFGFDLSALLPADAHGALDITLRVHSSDGHRDLLVPVILPRAAPPVAPPPRLTEPASRHADQPASGTPPLALTAVVLALGAVTLAGLARRQRRRGRGAHKPLGWIVLGNEGGTGHAIDRVPWRIGRGRNNDLVLADPSVSRLHAEVRRNQAGQLVINDLESLNGVFVNDHRTEHIQLRDGDMLDIGDVRLRFSAHEPGMTRPPRARRAR